MGHLTQIELGNFRVFGAPTHFEFAPLTILTGPNSSGKSSLAKALQLLKSSLHNLRLQHFQTDPLSLFEVLDFSGSNHQLGSFQKALTRDTPTDTRMHFCLPLGVEGLFQPMEIVLSYESDKDSVLGKGNLAALELRRRSDKLPFIEAQRNGETWSFRINFSAYHDRARAYLLEEGSSGVEGYPSPEAGHSSYLEQDFEQELEKEGFHTRFDASAPLLSYLAPTDANEAYLRAELKALDRFQRGRYDSPQAGQGLQQAFLRFIQAILSRSFLMVSHVDQNDLVLDAWKAGAISGDNSQLQAFIEEFIAGTFLKALDRLQQNLLDMSFIGSVRASVQRMYTSTNDAGFNQLIYRFLECNFTPEAEEIRFINHWLSAFNLGHQLTIKRDPQGVGSAVYLVSDGQERLLADLGYGITQFLPVLLHIAVVSHQHLIAAAGMYRSSLLFIEEPESNLHPRLQSLLADMLFDAIRRFSIQFVIETHSEYLVRKLQYLTAGDQISPNDSVIYYFSPPGNTADAPQDAVYKISIEKHGALSRPFGPGFFDESARLIGDTWKAANLS